MQWLKPFVPKKKKKFSKISTSTVIKGPHANLVDKKIDPDIHTLAFHDFF